MYSVQSRNTFLAASKFREAILALKGTSDVIGTNEAHPLTVFQFPIILVGHKSDLEEERKEVSFEQGVQLAQEWRVPFQEASAKRGENVSQIVANLLRLIASHNRRKNLPKLPPTDRRRGSCDIM
jgi:GTPase KRas protein